MKITRFEDLDVWKRAARIAVSIYEALETTKDYGFKDQLQRSAVSISNNIAEGFGRQTAKEFINFLFIARGSCNEVRSMLYLATRLNIIDKETADYLINESIEIAKMLYGLVESIKKDNNSNNKQ